MSAAIRRETKLDERETRLIDERETASVGEREVGPADERERAVCNVLEGVMDPEIPVLSIVDLGIVRYAHWTGDRRLHIGLTPTYSGCPATDVIRWTVREA